MSTIIPRLPPARLRELVRIAEGAGPATPMGDAIREIAALEQELKIAQDVAVREARKSLIAGGDLYRAETERDLWELRARRLGWVDGA